MRDFYVKTKDSLQKIELNEIFYFSKSKGRVVAVFKDFTLDIDGSLYYINELLGKNQIFFRCHKSFIVNINKISNISKFNNKTYNINFKGIKDTIYITQRNLKLFKEKVSII